MSKYAPNDPDVNRLMAEFDQLDKALADARERSTDAANTFVQRAQTIINGRDATIAQLRATIAERDAEIAHMVKHIPEPAPVYAIDRYMDNSDPHAEYEASAEGDADIYLIRKWLEGDA